MVAKHNRRQVVGPSKMLATPWQKPPEGILKVNWDAVVDGGRKMIGMGAIVRNSDGKVMAMVCDTMILIQDPVLAEALAAKRAVELCLSLGIRKIILEGDSLRVVHALQASNRGPSAIGPIVEDAWHLC
jgi:ribonuclease HI